MGKFLNIEGSFVKILGRIVDGIMLNLLFLLTSLPIFTIGCSWSALLSVYEHQEKTESTGACKSYFHFFRINFKQSLLLEVMILTIGFVILLLLRFFEILHFSAYVDLLMVTPLVILFAIIASTGFYYVSRYSDSIRNTIKICVKAFLVAPINLVMIIATNCGVVLSLFLSFRGMITMLYVFTFCGFSVIALINVKLNKKVFSKII